MQVTVQVLEGYRVQDPQFNSSTSFWGKAELLTVISVPGTQPELVWWLALLAPSLLVKRK